MRDPKKRKIKEASSLKQGGRKRKDTLVEIPVAFREYSPKKLKKIKLIQKPYTS